MQSGNYESSDSNVGTAVTFLLIGLGIGAAVALLLAPKTGKQLRKDLRRGYADAVDRFEDLKTKPRTALMRCWSAVLRLPTLCVIKPRRWGKHCGNRNSRCGFRLRLQEQFPSESCSQYSRKLTSTLICTATGCPSFRAGSKRHWRTASSAFSSRPSPSVRTMRMSRGRPSGPTTIHSTTVP